MPHFYIPTIILRKNIQIISLGGAFPRFPGFPENKMGFKQNCPGKPPIMTSYINSAPQKIREITASYDDHLRHIFV